MNSRIIAWALAGGAAIPLSGCNSSPRPAGERAAASVPAPKPPSPAHDDAVASSQLRERALALLVAATQTDDAGLHANALEAMLPVPSRLEPHLRRGLLDPDDRVRVVATMIVGKARLRGLLPFVQPLLTDRSELVRASAVFAVGACGEPVDQQPLASLLQHERMLFRAHAAYVLGEMGNPSALPMIRDAARDPLPRADPAKARILRLQLCEAMLKLGDDRALDEVRAALYPSRPEELEATALAVQILGQIGDHSSKKQLVELIDHVDPQSGRMPADIRLAAAIAMARLGQPHGGYVADEFRGNPEPSLRGLSALLYGETGLRQYLPVLEAMLSDPDPRVQVAAAAGILKITDRRSGGGSTPAAAR